MRANIVRTLRRASGKAGNVVPVIAAGILTASPVGLFAQVPDQSAPGESAVVPVFDGWFPNEDGGSTLCFGYENPETEDSFDIPLGPLNLVEPAEYDGVQPTHFDPSPSPEPTSSDRRHRCVFTVDLSADSEDDAVLWTLTSLGNRLTASGSLDPEARFDGSTSLEQDAGAPRLRMGLTGALTEGPRGIWEGPVRARVGQPVTLMAWVSHDAPGTRIGWTKHQGPGQVSFDEREIRVDSPEGVAEVTATFDEPGRYVLRIRTINDSGIAANPTDGSELQCCWTNAYLSVEVQE